MSGPDVLHFNISASWIRATAKSASALLANQPGLFLAQYLDNRIIVSEYEEFRPDFCLICVCPMTTEVYQTFEEKYCEGLSQWSTTRKHLESYVDDLIDAYRLSQEKDIAERADARMSGIDHPPAPPISM